MHKEILRAISALLVFFRVCFAASNAAASSQPIDSQWLALVHYRPRIIGGYVSTIESPDFFISQEGKTNPEAELAAAVALFELGEDKTKICLFPARYNYLRNKGLVKRPFPFCEAYQQFRKDIAPAGATLLFTNAYMNNPSSLFGHTLIRIDTARKGTQLLAHGMNYGAFTGEENSLLFALYGLGGGYYGGFTIKPYYDIINTYNNIENRDIWELNLDFSPQEMETLIAHLWEIGHAQSRYYFFSRNCSYMLMEVLDAVRPSLKLADDFPMQAIPLDMIKAANSRPGLVKSIHYRPSRQNIIKNQHRQMSRFQKQAFEKLILSEKVDFINLSDTEKAGALETAYQFVQYQYVAGKLELTDYRKQSFKYLSERNKLNVKDSFIPLTSGENPLAAHKAMRGSFGVGARNGQGFQELVFRPAYHSLTDDNFGMLPGAEINFFNLAVRHYDRDDKYVLQRFDIAGVRSVVPQDLLFKPISYNLKAGIEREVNPDNEKEGYVFNLTAGAGGSYALNNYLQTYLLMNTHWAYGGFLPHNQWFGAGMAVGMLGNWRKLRGLVEAEKIYATSQYGDKIKFKAELVYGITRNSGLALNYTYHHNHGHDLDESMFSWRWHF